MCLRVKQKGVMRESNSRPPAPKAGIIPLDQSPKRVLACTQKGYDSPLSVCSVKVCLKHVDTCTLRARYVHAACTLCARVHATVHATVHVFCMFLLFCNVGAERRALESPEEPWRALESPGYKNRACTQRARSVHAMCIACTHRARRARHRARYRARVLHVSVVLQCGGRAESPGEPWRAPESPGYKNRACT